MRNGKLVFAVNGERFEIPTHVHHPSTTLLEFLRYHTRFKSVKLGCGEGGCGACVVLLSKYNSALEKLETYTIASCLTLICSVNGCSITTSEGLGNSKDGFHPIHQRFAGFHASQCGFCTPGMCVSLSSALINSEKKPRPDPPEGFSKLTPTEAELAIAGNLCRCTGYRPIADACKSFAADVDIEDLGINCFWRKDEPKDVKISRLPLYNPSYNYACSYPEFLKAECKSPVILDSPSYSWHSPVTVEELRGLLSSMTAENSKRTRIVVGNTGAGYYKELSHYDKFIDLRYVPELSVIRRDEAGLQIGAAATISDVISTLRDENEGFLCGLGSDDKVFLGKIADHMDKVASGFVRNSASIGGNLVMAQRNCFPSDIATLLLAAGSFVSIVTGAKHQRTTLEDFLTSAPLDSRSVLLDVQIPLWNPKTKDNSSVSESKFLFETFRAAPRPLGNALPYLNAAFLADVCNSKDGALVNDIRLVFGAYGTKHTVRARKVEEYLIGKVISIDVLSDAVNLVKEAVVPEEGTSYPAYRSSLAVSFLFEFLHPFVNDHNPIPHGLSNGLVNSSLENGEMGSSTLLSSAKQVVESSREYFPVGEPLPKFAAAIQASGEAVYVDDIPSPPNCLYGALIYSTKPLARVKSIDFKPNSLPDGVTTVITSKDIPTGGKNVGAKTSFGPEPLFADDLIGCAGDRIALVVADTQKSADMAASLAMVNYETENLDPPILTVEAAVERSSFFEVPPFLQPKQVGDISKGMAEADHKILCAKLRLGSQYYYYMETQTALAVPDEDNCMVVYSSSQVPEIAQVVISTCLGIPEHNVRVITRRVGGGFGGKAIKAMPIAAACALAAQKLGRPVRMYLNRKTDMIMAGGRHPMKITYSVGFKSSGKITALKLDIQIDSGIWVDVSPILPSNLIGVLKKYDWGTLSFDIKLCKTNNPSRSAMRGPGEVQGSYIAEAIIEQVASRLQMDVDSVRNKNLHTFESLGKFYTHLAGDKIEYTLPTIWDKLARSSRYFEKLQMIKHFNLQNRWRKRGISRVPMVNEVMLRPTPGKASILRDGSIVVEVGGIELGQGLWTKVKQMTAYGLSLIQCDGTANLDERVRVIQADTLSMVQGGFTAGSTTSETSCEAVRLCCNILVERLTPLKKQIQEETGYVNWDRLILQANLKSVNLAASAYFVPDYSSLKYLNYGAAVSEVEVNILTGETKILQADIIYDCGQSLNPAVDLGQIEGAFVQGIGFFMLEEYLTNTDGLVVTDSTWTYKIPTIDTIPKQFNVEVLNSGHHQKRVLSSKASGEPPLFLAVSVHCATRAAIEEARKQLRSWSRSGDPGSEFQLDVPATMPVVKSLCGFDIVEKYLQSIPIDKAKQLPDLNVTAK